MPLPNSDSVWPPPMWAPALHKMREHAAWFSGDADLLGEIYAQEVTFLERQGFWKFWNRSGVLRRETRLRQQMHLPIAGDVASTSASLLFSEQPDITVDDDQTQKRLETIIDDTGLYSTLLEAAETAAALGGIFLRVQWDKEVYGYPFISVVQPDMAVPEFRWGQLSAVTFWSVARQEKQTVWRLLERYEHGVILTGLYEGTADKLGERVDLTRLTETEDIPEEIRLPEGLKDKLIVRYIPNMLPNRRWRSGPMKHLGQSDYSGAETMLDALDEVWTSWIRDVRLGRARLIVPEEYIERRDGNMRFDPEAEIFTPVDMDARNAGKTIEHSQFEIRSEDHARTAMDLIERIVTHAGYSPQTFGLQIQGRAESGTALRIRERKSLITQQKKRQYFEPALGDLLEMLLAVDKWIFPNASKGKIVRPDIQLADSITPDPGEIAQVLDLLNRAQAISTEQKVKMVHPTWSEQDVLEEIRRISEEQGLIVANPDELQA